MLLWRAYACSLDSVREACKHQVDADEQFSDQLRWLHKAGLLPMNAHRAYGSLFVRSVGQFNATNPELNETVVVSRRVNILANDGVAGTPRNLLNSLRGDWPILPSSPEDPRLALRNGSFWRFAGHSSDGRRGNHSRSARKRQRTRPVNQRQQR